MKHGIKKTTIGTEILIKSRKLYTENEKYLDLYIDLLLDWNQKINLVSRNVSRETVREHIVHSLLPLSMDLIKRHSKWIDSGTGAGIPGIPLAICNRNTEWQLNDNVRKKMRAVDDIIDSLQLKNTSTLTKSISLVDLEKGTGIATKHAFKIPDLLKLLGNKPWKTILMWKGAEDAEEEILRSRKKLNCTLFEFNFGQDEPFYEGKGLLLIER
ncbi:MAG: class I SAM-dependent methyltransferase [Balneolaceae bacterium]|nr:class I SAM-dependent methyltransferase [Balneolaceae bacterium]